MKRNVFLTVTLAIVLAFSMAVIGCDDGSGNGKEPGNTGTPEEMEYTSIGNDGNKYQLIITKNTDEKQPRAFTPSGGDAYVLLITRDNQLLATSRGTVESNTGGTLTLKHQTDSAEFSVTISSSGTMTAITVSGGGAIPGTTVAAPGAGMTADSSNNQDGNTANPFVGTWVYSLTRAQLAQEMAEDGITEQMLISAGFPADMSTTYTFNANMSFVVSGYSYGWSSDGEVRTPVPITFNGTYTVSGNTAIITYTSGVWAGYESEVVISGNTLIVDEMPLTKK